jgi:hypothetical protein
MKLFLYLVTRLYWAVDCPGSTYFLGTAGPEYLTSLKSCLNMGPYFFMKNISGLDDSRQTRLSWAVTLKSLPRKGAESNNKSD